jgi:hypothetical protein
MRLAAVAEARRLDGADVEHAAQLVDHEGREGLALDVLGDDEQAACRCSAILPSTGSRSFTFADLLLVDEDVGVLEHRPPSSRRW